MIRRGFVVITPMDQVVISSVPPCATTWPLARAMDGSDGDIACMEDVESDAEKTDVTSAYDGWVVQTTKSNGKPCVCQLCNAQSTGPSPLKSASPGDKHGGKRPWLEYTNCRAEKQRRVKGRKCFLCAMVWNIRGWLEENCCVLLLVVCAHLCFRAGC